MGTKYLYIIAIFLLSQSASAQEISVPDQGPFDGLQSALDKFTDDAGQNYESLKQMYDELVRMVLLGHDIRMTMNATFKKTEIGDRLLGYYTSERTGDLYAEFDWQNLATSMRAKSSKSSTGVFALGSHMGNNRPEEEFTMYFKAGYVYVPYEQDGVHAGYIKANLPGIMQNVAKTLQVGIEAAIEAKVAEMLDQLGALLTLKIYGDDELSKELLEFIPSEIFMEYLNQLSAETNEEGLQLTFDDTKNVTEKKLKTALEELAKLQFERISNIPPLIHFAFIISPTLARTQFNVQEIPVTWRGQENCMQMTVLSGRDAGYQIVFDRYGRLIHLRDTDDATADYFYDKDVKVTIPPSVSPGDFSLKKSAPSQNKSIKSKD